MAPFIVTLAALLFARGLLLAITHEGATTYQIGDRLAFLWLGRGTLLGIGYPVYLALLLFALGGAAAAPHPLRPVAVRHRRRRVLRAADGPAGGPHQDQPSTRSAALLAGFAGALTAAYLQSGVTVIGVGTELDAISAVVIGGTLLTGGAGTVLGTLVGVLLRNVIQNVINQIGTLDSNYQSVVSGGFLLVVVVIQRLLARSRTR